MLSHLLQLKASLMHMVSGLGDTIGKRTKGAGDIFLKIMLKVAVIKMALGLVALMVMTTLYFLHLQVFEPITMRFSEWVSSPLIGFIISILIVKFAGISIYLTVLIVKKTTIDTLLLRLWGFKNLRLPVISTASTRGKVQLQTN